MNMDKMDSILEDDLPAEKPENYTMSRKLSRERHLAIRRRKNRSGEESPPKETCRTCKFPKDVHDMYHEEWAGIWKRLGFKCGHEKPTNSEKFAYEVYSWVPSGLPGHLIEKYFWCLPQHVVPKLGTQGERSREQQLIYQLPKQDFALAYTKYVTKNLVSSYIDFIKMRNDTALDMAYVREVTMNTSCMKCQKVLSPGQLCVITTSYGESCLWHPGCFTCSYCDQLLVDLIYCSYDDTVFCERHYAERLKPRCADCDELIFTGEYTRALNIDWHSGHFCCWHCDKSLTGKRYVLKDGHAYCHQCFEAHFANSCLDCGRIIGIDCKEVSYQSMHWHEDCFLCSSCQKSLIGVPFGPKENKLFCGDCYNSNFASKCFECSEIFIPGAKKMEYKNKKWHEKCFCCAVCKKVIGTKCFIPKDQEIYCVTCYEDKFVTKCKKCNKIIISGGVTYKNDPWHKECFTCTNCNTSLAGQRFTSRESKPYCAECFGEMFAKRCFSCKKPIVGIGSTRFISFEDRHWHNDCFICAACDTSLVGRGFITDGEEIICPECVKQKLL